jgi:hypothetical protein
MTKEERLAGNRLIAEFMSRSFSMSHISDYKGCSDDCLPPMKYHKDWNWIIPVYKKIVVVAAPIKEKEAEIFKGSGVTWTSECGELTWAVYSSCRDFDIEKVFLAIVNWIKWYNKQTQ